VGRFPRGTEDSFDAAASHRLAEDLDAAVALGAPAVEEATGLVVPSQPVARVVDRAAWVHRNVAAFEQLLEPALRRLEERQVERRANGLVARLGIRLPEGIERTASGLASTASGAQLGLLLAWMSTKVLGQYEVLVAPEEDEILFVGPNLVEIERRHGFPPRAFRTWVALHELAHRAQFRGVPWLRSHFLELTRAALELVQPDLADLANALRQALERARRGESLLGPLGVLGLFAGPERMEVLERVQALMSLLEGHGDVVMERCAKALVPEAGWFAEVVANRRRAGGLARLAREATGLSVKLRQYDMGARFVAEVERQGGPALLNRLWEGPEWLPSMAEVLEPTRWVERVRGQASRP
jgi:coenzyme F420 biosynthesis associated uncharacterized protein